MLNWTVSGFFGHDSNTSLLELKLYKSSKSVSIETKQVVWPNYRLARSDQLLQSTGLESHEFGMGRQSEKSWTTVRKAKSEVIKPNNFRPSYGDSNLDTDCNCNCSATVTQL